MNGKAFTHNDTRQGSRASSLSLILKAMLISNCNAGPPECLKSKGVLFVARTAEELGRMDWPAPVVMLVCNGLRRGAIDLRGDGCIGTD